MIARNLSKIFVNNSGCQQIRLFVKDKMLRSIGSARIAQLGILFNEGAKNSSSRGYQFQPKIFCACFSTVVLGGIVYKKALCEDVDEGEIPNDILIQAKDCIDSSAYVKLREAKNGRSQVFLHNDFVLKRDRTCSSLAEKNQSRLEVTKKIRKFCTANSYNHLIVPRVGLYGAFIVEDRIPISSCYIRGYMSLYLENYEKFTEAVREFTELLCQTEGWDLTGGRDPYPTFPGKPPGRYDNIPLYLDNEKGFIGLIDLEGVGLIREPLKNEECNLLGVAKLAIYLFPYHFEEIMGVLQKRSPNIKNHQDRLEVIRNQSLETFDIMVKNHADFIKRKQITLDNPIKFDRLTKERERQLQDVFLKKLIEWNENGHEEFMGPFEGCLGEDPQKTLSEFSQKVFPAALEGVYKIIEGSLARKIEEKGISCFWELLELRALKISYDGGEKFADSIRSKLNIFSFQGRGDRWHDDDMIKALLDAFLTEMQVGGEIACYKDSGRYSSIIFF